MEERTYPRSNPSRALRSNGSNGGVPLSLSGGTPNVGHFRCVKLKATGGGYRRVGRTASSLWLCRLGGGLTLETKTWTRRLMPPLAMFLGFCNNLSLLFRRALFLLAHRLVQPLPLLHNAGSAPLLQGLRNVPENVHACDGGAHSLLLFPLNNFLIPPFAISLIDTMFVPAKYNKVS